jgi:hypothetical protein
MDPRRENGRRLPPPALSAAVAGECLAIGRTRLYESLREGSIPTIAGTGRARKVPAAWIAEQLHLTPEQLAELLPEKAWR